MRSLVVVEAQVALEGGIEVSEPREVPAAELDAPVLVKDRLLQSLDEAIGKGVSGLRPGVADAERSARLVEGALELASAVGEDPLERVSGLAEEGNDLLAEELGNDSGPRRTDEDLGQGEGRGRVAGGDLPDLPWPSVARRGCNSRCLDRTLRPRRESPLKDRSARCRAVPFAVPVARDSNTRHRC